METVVIIFHVLACLVLVFIVLLQTGKGAEMGAVFGTSSSSVFGPTGPANILTKITIVAAVVFMLTSLYLTTSIARRTSRTIVPVKTKTAPAPQIPAPAQPMSSPQPLIPEKK